MKSAIAGLVLALMMSGAQARELCRWSASGGPEPHLIAGFVGAGGVTLATRSQVAGIIAVNIAGALKERTDRKRGGWCSGKDLTANLIGSLAGAHTAGQLLLWQTERGTTMVGYSRRW